MIWVLKLWLVCYIALGMILRTDMDGINLSSAATTLTSWHLLVTFCSLHVALRLKLFAVQLCWFLSGIFLYFIIFLFCPLILELILKVMLWHVILHFSSFVKYSDSNLYQMLILTWNFVGAVYFFFHTESGRCITY